MRSPVQPQHPRGFLGCTARFSPASHRISGVHSLVQPQHPRAFLGCTAQFSPASHRISGVHGLVQPGIPRDFWGCTAQSSPVSYGISGGAQPGPAPQCLLLRSCPCCLGKVQHIQVRDTDVGKLRGCCFGRTPRDEGTAEERGKLQRISNSPHFAMVK